MAEDFHFEGFDSPTYTPVPDQFFDHVMTHLTEAELRVALYIVRRTFGFKKQQDSISLSQMVDGIVKKDGEILDEGTGMARSSVTRALRGLEEKGIIVPVRRKSANGVNQTTVYALNLRGNGRPSMVAEGGSSFAQPPTHPMSHSLITEQGWLPKETTRSSFAQPPVVAESYPQDTVLQETPEQETVNSNIRFSPPSRKNGTEYGEDRQVILEYVEDLAREFRDRASLKSSTSRAVNLHKQSGLSLDEFLQRLQEARAITKERSASIRSQEEGSASKHKMAYFFACLENILETHEAEP